MVVVFKNIQCRQFINRLSFTALFAPTFRILQPTIENCDRNCIWMTYAERTKALASCRAAHCAPATDRQAPPIPIPIPIPGVHCWAWTMPKVPLPWLLAWLHLAPTGPTCSLDNLTSAASCGFFQLPFDMVISPSPVFHAYFRAQSTAVDPTQMPFVLARLSPELLPASFYWWR